MSSKAARVGVLGGGAWGTALAIHCARAGHHTIIWAMEPEVDLGKSRPLTRACYVVWQGNCLQDYSTKSNMAKVPAAL